MIAVFLVILISNSFHDCDWFLNDLENITYTLKPTNVTSVSRSLSSYTKIQSVLDFPLPTVGKQLKSFLGAVNYLRDFVRNHSIIVKPLHDLIANYDKTR